MANILIIDDDSKIRMFLADILDGLGHTTAEAGSLKEATKKAQDGSYELILLDLDLPDGSGLEILPSLTKISSAPEVIIVTGTGDAGGAQIAFKYGAWDYVQKPFTMDEVSFPITRALEYHREKIKTTQPVSLKRKAILGSSNIIQNRLDDVARAATSIASVLITGETGTGKELFARAIHENSKRSSGPFIAVDCGALTESLAEESFFGHEKGAFTGADTKREGLITLADGGTLFLDEIGDLAENIQRSLLRALQEKIVRPLGGKEISVDFRLVAATNRDLTQRVKDSLFREDLLYRIRAIEIKLPPLRARKEDIEEIVLSKIPEICIYNNSDIKGVSPEFIKALMNHKWPGNVRELINVLEFALASAVTDPTLHPKHLPPEYRVALLKIEDNTEANQPVALSESKILQTDGEFPKLSVYREDAEKKYFAQLIKLARGDRQKACQLAGLSQARLYGILKKYNLSLFNPF